MGAGYDGRDPRIKLQLERTGLEYLVVRRHQDPVGAALKRLASLPGVERNRRIPVSQGKKDGNGTANGGSGSVGRYGLSHSLKGKEPARNVNGGGSHESVPEETGREGDEGVGVLLRSMWEKGFDLSASAE